MISTEYLTEFLYLLTTRTVVKGLQPIFSDSWIMMTARPVGFFGKFKKLPREINFKDVNHSNSKDKPWVKKVSKYSYEILVLNGLPKDSRPKAQGGFLTNLSEKTGYSVKVNRNSQVFGLQVQNSVGNNGLDIYDEVPGEVNIPYRQTSLKQNLTHSGSVAVRHKQAHGLKQNQFKASPQAQNTSRNVAASNQLDDAMNGLMEQVSNINSSFQNNNSGFRTNNSGFQTSDSNFKTNNSGFQTHNSGFNTSGNKITNSRNQINHSGVQTSNQTNTPGFKLGGMYSSPTNMQQQLSGNLNSPGNQHVNQYQNPNGMNSAIATPLAQIGGNQAGGFQVSSHQVIGHQVMGQTNPPKPRPKPKPKPKRNNCKALYDYDAQDNDELTLKIGDVIQILEETAGGWWKGKLNGTIGLFPGNYVEKL